MTSYPHRIQKQTLWRIISGKTQKEVYYHKILVQLNVDDGTELRRVQLPDYMNPCHAVESPTGTFIVSHNNEQGMQDRITDRQTDGHVVTGGPVLKLLWAIITIIEHRLANLVTDTTNRPAIAKFFLLPPEKYLASRWSTWDHCSDAWHAFIVLCLFVLSTPGIQLMTWPVDRPPHGTAPLGL